MPDWSIEFYEDEGMIILRGKVPLKHLHAIATKFCKPDWVMDSERSREYDATFVFCKPELARESLHAVNQ